MSDEQHIEEWTRIETALRKEIPNLAGYALVAVMDNGATHWGADFECGSEVIVRGLKRTLGEVQALGKAKP